MSRSDLEDDPWSAIDAAVQRIKQKQSDASPDRPLADQHAIITGGHQGIGAAISTELARLGADLTIVGRSPSTLSAFRDKTSQTYEVSVQDIIADVTDYEALSQGLTWSCNLLGNPKILINNVGFPLSAPIEEISSIDFQHVVNLNLTSSYNASLAVVPMMVENGGGIIINIAAAQALTAPPLQSAYSAAKSGLIGLTKSLAAELADRNIKVHALCPELTLTEAVAEALQALANANNQSLEQVLKDISAQHGLERLTTMDEIAAAAARLILTNSEQQSGQIIHIPTA